MATTKNPQVLYIGKTTRDKIVVNTALPSKVVTIVVNSTPVISLSAVEAEGLIDLLVPHTITIEKLAHEVRACLYNYPVKQ
ncbi:MAG: hypothetical protein ACXWPS_09410 [Ktedonobacteraceae bacterium]